MSGAVIVARQVERDDLGTIEWGDDAISLTISHARDTAPWISGIRASDVRLQMPPGLPLVDVVTVDRGRTPASSRLVHSTVGAALRYRDHVETEDDRGRRLRLELVDESGELGVVLHLRILDGIAAVHVEAEVHNLAASRPVVLRSVTTFSTCLGTAAGPRPAWVLHHAASDWLGEGRWQSRPLDALLPALEEQRTGHNLRGEFRATSSGTWSTGRSLPTAALSSAAGAFAWQIEHNGGWRWEVGDDIADRWFALAGPTDDDHQWTAALAPGATFTTVPATIAVGATLTAAVGALTRYRRSARRPHPDNAAMPVVFNDYMNTLNGDPTTERLLPLIDAAAEVGCEVFCVDAGWYADGFWWDSVGQWRPSARRFPGGLGEVLEHIRSRGMVAGLWLEPEVIGVQSPVAALLPDEAFLTRHGQRVVEHGRYHLDLRHPAAVAHLDEVVDRLVGEDVVGFFKFDYNINPGAGTDRDAASAGDGLLQHNRAHLAWLDAVLDRHPTLIVENCASGAMRADFAMLSRLQLQSTSDQQGFLRYPPIAAAAPMQMLPEQAASWAYPQPDMTLEQVAFCLVTGLLGRFYLSGYLNAMSDEQRGLVAEAVRAAKDLRHTVRTSTPFWPIGLPRWDDPHVALGLTAGSAHLVALWDRGDGATPFTFELPDLAGAPVRVEQIFPTSLPSWTAEWEQGGGVLRVHNPTGQVGARVLRIQPSSSAV